MYFCLGCDMHSDMPDSMLSVGSVDVPILGGSRRYSIGSVPLLHQLTEAMHYRYWCNMDVRAHDNFLEVSGHNVLTSSRMPGHSHICSDTIMLTSNKMFASFSLLPCMQL